jgi:predicted O-methyltransferase YrrM
MKPSLHDFLVQVVPPPVAARHVEYSLIVSADDDPSPGPDRALLELALDAARLAFTTTVDELRDRTDTTPFLPGVWPGEHYRLLASLTLLLKPRLVLEIGTGGGLAALTIARRLPEGGRVVTFDVRHWSEIPHTSLRPTDLQDGTIEFRLDDLSSDDGFDRHRNLVANADLIVLDAAKDGVGEPAMIRHLESVTFVRPPIVLLDDIRLWNMVNVWRTITRPKLDITSFGHWSGTGIVRWEGTR